MFIFFIYIRLIDTGFCRNSIGSGYMDIVIIGIKTYCATAEIGWIVCYYIIVISTITT